METRFTASQQQAVEKAYESLGEQFEGVLIVVMATVEPEPSEENVESVRCFYAGGRTLAIGLAAEAQHVIQNSVRSTQEP